MKSKHDSNKTIKVREVLKNLTVQSKRLIVYEGLFYPKFAVQFNQAKCLVQINNRADRAIAD